VDRNFLKSRLLGFTVLLSCLALLGASATASASPAPDDFGNAKLVISNRPDEHISGLRWKNYDPVVRVEQVGDERRAVVDIEGYLARSDANLVFNQTNVPLTPFGDGATGKFAQTIQLTGKTTVLTYYFVDPFGRAQTEKIVLVFPKWSRFSAPPKIPRRLLMSVGLGLSYENYNEPGNIQMTEYALTGKFAVTYTLTPNKWELGANVFGNLLPFDNNPSDRVSARWFGLNGRIGYRLPTKILPATNIWVMMGWYYWGMLVNADQNDTYGVAYLGGPQLLINFRVSPRSSHAWWFYVKYAGIEDHLQIFSLTSRELAVGTGIEVSEKGARHPLSLTLDFANAAYSSSTTSQSFNLDSLTAGVSMGL
jgi:hypothetical protein